MAALTNDQLEARREELITQFNAYREQITGALDDVVRALSAGEYARACSVMSTVSAHQAQASIRMRAVLVKNGFIVRERNDA